MKGVMTVLVKAFLWVLLAAFGLVALFVAYLTLASYGAFSTVYELRYRLSAEFDTPDGVRSNSSVIRVTLEPALKIDPVQKDTRRMHGEAVFVDLGAGKNAIMLLEDQEIWRHAYGVYGNGTEEAWTGKITLSGIRVLPLEFVPTIITFTDIADPLSAKVIVDKISRQECEDPRRQLPNCPTKRLYSPVDAVAATLGEGYAFRRATLEMVPNTTPVTTGIEGKLPKWKVSTYDDVINPDGTHLTPEQRNFYVMINRSFKRNR